MVGWGAKVHPASSGTAGSTKPTNITIYTLECTDANTEYSFAFPDNTYAIRLKEREMKSILRLSFIENGTDDGGVYTTVHIGNSWDESFIDFTGITAYIRSNRASVTIEIEVLTA